MKPAYVADLKADQTITSFFLVADREIRQTREGNDYLRLELADCTGSLEARMWENFEAAAQDIERDDFVKVRGRVELYRDRFQLVVEKIRRARDAEIDVVDYFPHTTHDVEQLYRELHEVPQSFENPWLKRLVLSVIEDPEIRPRLKRAPAAKGMHHACLGGLLEHVVSLCGVCRAVAARYPEANLDLLLTGAVLHDIGKIDELEYQRSFGYTTEGQLLGHIVLELEIAIKTMDAIEGFPRELKTVVEHLLISHHGQYAFGSPKLPMFREAVLLHYLDDLDSKMAAIRAAMAAQQGEGHWTGYSAALERRLLRLEQYLNGAGRAQEPRREASEQPEPKLPFSVQAPEEENKG